MLSAAYWETFDGIVMLCWDVLLLSERAVKVIRSCGS
jgi:hypothetical protein